MFTLKARFNDLIHKKYFTLLLNLVFINILRQGYEIFYGNKLQPVTVAWDVYVMCERITPVPVI